MSLMIQLPATVEERLRAKAKSNGQPLEEMAATLLINLSQTTPSTSQDWLDADYHAECEADPSPEVSLDDVRQILSKIPGSMTADFIAERDE